MAKPKPKIWKFALKCMREQKWCQTKLRKWAIFRSLGKTYYNLHSTRRKCPPISGGLEASLGMETSSSTRYFQKSFFENVLPTEGGEHILIKIAKNWRNHASKHQQSNFLKQVTEIAKMNCKLWLKNGLKSKKCSRPSREQHFFRFLVAEEGPTEGDWKG